MDMALYDKVLKEHENHLLVPNHYSSDKDVYQLCCWTCRRIYFFSEKNDYAKLKAIQRKEHWLYNDWPDEFQHHISGGIPTYCL